MRDLIIEEGAQFVLDRQIKPGGNIDLLCLIRQLVVQTDLIIVQEFLLA